MRVILFIPLLAIFTKFRLKVHSKCYNDASFNGILSHFNNTGEDYILEGYEYNPTYTVKKLIPDPTCINQRTEIVVLIKRFDTFNIYEMMHSILNTHFLIKMFDLNRFSIMFEDDLEDTQLNTDMFRLFTKDVSTKKDCVGFNNNVIISKDSYTSILSTKHGVLRGRSVEHHCESDIVKSFVKETLIKLNILKIPSNKIVWSSRQVHSRGKLKRYTPTRMILDEEELIEALRELGHDIVVVDFAKLSAYESIRIVANSKLLVGVHGAGLTWGMFGNGILEIFGGDRGPGNKHYHNLASLANIPYDKVLPGLLAEKKRNFLWNGSKKFLERLHGKLNNYNFVNYDN